MWDVHKIAWDNLTIHINVFILLNMMPIFEWYRVRLVTMDTQKYICFFVEIGLCAHKLHNIRGSRVSMIGRARVLS